MECTCNKWALTFWVIILLGGLQAGAVPPVPPGSPVPPASPVAPGTLSYLGIEQGLSNNAVRCIFQDHRGFMWFGTYDGLNRYDGNGFRIFRNKFNDSNSLVNSWILSINEDTANNLWVGTRKGVSVYNSVAEKFYTPYYIPFTGGGRQKITSVVRSIKRDIHGNMLMASESLGLLFYPEGAANALQIPFHQEGGYLTNYDAQAIEPDDKGNVWLFIANKGLCRLDGKTRQLTLVNSSFLSANCMKASGGYLWVGTGNGVYEYDVLTNTYTHHYSEAEGGLSYNKVADLFPDRDGALWIATNGGGIDILNTKTGAMDYLLPGNNNNSLTSESVYALYEDRDYRKWIGTLRGGINIIDPQKDRFLTIRHDPFNSNSLISNFIFAFCEDQDGSLWVGTDGGGLSHWDRQRNQFTNYRHDGHDEGSLSDNFITGIERDKSGDIWIATYWGGVSRLNKATHRFKRYACVSPGNSVENKTVFLLYQDRAGEIWAGTLHGGALYRYNRETDGFELFNDRLADLVCMEEDAAGNLWAGNFEGLIRIDKKRKDYVFFNLGQPVRAIHEDKGGRLWLGTEGGGLILFDREKGKVAARYTTDEGLTNNSVLNILEDGDGNMWMSTYNGISKFNISGRTFKNYYQGDGLQGNQFNYNAALSLRSGEFVFGGIRGFSLFYPARIVPVANFPGIFLTGIRINNVPVGNKNPLITEKTNDAIQRLRIPYKEAVFSFDFTAPEYSAPNKIAYAYYMEGWDPGWTYTGNNRTATYTHLEEGSYIFRVKCTNTEGVWNAKEVALRITVLPPWYRTWWAYMLYAAAMIACIYFYLFYKAKQTRLTYEVKIAKLNAEKERDINEKKLSFFTNVSHEFRTPLTLIINPIKDLLEKKGPGTPGETAEFSIIYRNARRLLRLLDQLLLFRKAESEADVLKPARLDFSALCKEVYLYFVQQARHGQVDYVFHCEKEALEIYGDREKLEIVLCNLISNALKYTPAGGRVSVELTDQGDSMSVKVTDTGYGIPGEVGRRLFEKFYRAEGYAAAAKPGFGIGLYLVKYFTEKHNGAVDYTSEEGKGTCFTLTLPKGELPFNDSAVMGEAGVEGAVREGTGIEGSVMGGAGMGGGFLEELVEDQAALEEKGADAIESGGLNEFITGKQQMLVIDDDIQIRQYVSAVFKNNFTVYEAENGADGVKLAREKLPDIIISDIKMQGISGIELCRIVKEDPSLAHIPVILLTGTPSSDLKLEGVEGGADDYITKPFEKELLIARVGNLLKSHDNLRRYFFNEITLNQNNLKISGEYKLFLEKCIAIVEKNLENESFSISTLAADIGMSHSAIYKKIKLISGQSLNGFIRFIRLRKAAELFINSTGNINEVSSQVGINDAKYFREQFTKLFGMRPSEYIKKYRKPFEDKYTLNRENF